LFEANFQPQKAQAAQPGSMVRRQDLQIDFIGVAQWGQ
jgi:hypothetical protein